MQSKKSAIIFVNGLGAAGFTVTLSEGVNFPDKDFGNVLQITPLNGDIYILLERGSLYYSGVPFLIINEHDKEEN